MTYWTNFQTYCKKPVHSRTLRAQIQAKIGFRNRFPDIGHRAPTYQALFDRGFFQLVERG